MLALGVLLYTANYFGVRLAVWTSGVMALCALTPLTIILTASLVRDGGWRASFFSFGGDGHAAALAATPLSFAKWMFVAVWSSYAGEMAATLTGELRDRARDTARVIVLAGFVTFVAFAIVPVVLVGAVGADALANDPYVVFLTAARGIFGARGSAVISIMLIAALLCGAQLFVISSSRALYQLSRDNLAFRSWSRLNRYGVPVGSLGWDAAVTVSLVAIFRERVVDVVAAANVSYLLVFVLLPWTYLHVSARERSHDGEFALRRVGVPIARGVLLLNAALLIVGGVQWGLVVTIVGAGLALMGVPVYLFLDRTGALRNNPPRFCRPHRGGSFGDSRCPGR
jgi:amino acid transporter